MRAPSVRNTLLLVAAATLVYTLAIIVALTLSAVHNATLADETQAVSSVFGELRSRVARDDAAVQQARLILNARGVPDLVVLGRLRQMLPPLATGETVLAARAVPAVIRRSLARADDRAAILENAFFDAIARAELGNHAGAVERLAAADSAAVWAGDHLREAEQVGLADLVQRQRTFGRWTQRAVLAVMIWAGVGLLAIPLVIVIWHWRVRDPLARLDHAMDAVAAGDLTVRVAPHRDDEIGRLGAHFDAMTRVLHARAEQQGRLAAAGELVAGVAHEVNNPLMAIALLAETRLEDVRHDDALREDLQHILRQARRAGTLLTGLLRFARPGEPRVESIDVNRLVEASVDLVSYQFAVDEIHVERQLHTDLPVIDGDAGRIEQVLVNLLSNAVQALREVPVPRRLTVSTWPTPTGVAIAVADNGPGVDAHLRERVFLPFFTTKGDGGTGLGLYISRQIVREAGGDLTFEPEHGSGARFVVTLPEAGGEPRAADKRREAARAPASDRTDLGGLHILIVDDEEPVRTPLAKFLSRRGADVLQAADGLEALTMLERYSVDVIVLDLRMPRMSGPEFYRALQRTHPTLASRVLFLSGDLRQLQDASTPEVPDARRVAKPVDLAELEARIKSVIA